MLNNIKKKQPVDDAKFDLLFPEEIRAAASFHFTPVEIAKATADFLIEETGMKVLDVGAGAGKFCLVGAAHTQGHFTGVEQRKQLVTIAQKLATQFDLNNTNFLHDNLTNLHFSDYKAFYIFNPFMEHQTPDDSLDADLKFDRALYYLYSDFVKGQLERMPKGTRLATYFSHGDEVPGSYVKVGGDENAKLRFWVKG